MKYIYLIVLTVILISCKQNKSDHNLPENKEEIVEKMQSSEDSIQLDVYDFNGFKKFLTQNDDKIHVINFWATWCAPCVKELPFFEKINTQFANKNVEVVLVSLDFPHLYESKLKPFIVDHHIKSKVIALDDVDMNSWIPQVNKDWSGSIPATIIYKNDDFRFFEQSFTYETLENEILRFLK
ncbi:MAG: TlpA family protein disulfide reductase [Flavobacteriaceae bacterium]|jgi:thiol-disulfide isomerase/thioredoxin|nr:TlpA family protein disulfide reductase [Flavobacteriaceae bacterium]